MTKDRTEVLIVGGGQAGIAMSEHLTARGIDHLILERSRVAERWRSERWDSLVTNGPVWHDRFPGREFTGVPADSFVPKDAVADYLEAYAEQIAAPVRVGVEVLRVTREEGRPGFRVDTSEGQLWARYVVAATGAFQEPHIPPLIPESHPVQQLHSSAYRHPGQLTPGAVLVVGAGSSGVQIAAELREAGREMFLAVGPHERPPRRYRHRDFVWWLGVLGLWEAAAPAAGMEHVTIAVSGVHGGHTVDLRDLAASGISLIGRANSFAEGVVRLGADLERNLTFGDETYLAILRGADAYISEHGLDLPEEPEAHVLGPLPESVRTPVRELRLAEEGITTVVWATGFTSDYGWLPPAALTPDGAPNHERGVSALSGVYFLGLPWQSRRGSSFIWGVWHDARALAEHVVIQERYRAYAGSAAVIS